MKNILIALMGICLLPLDSFSQDIKAFTSKDVHTDGKDDCVSVKFSIPVPYLRSDCPEANQSDVNITYRFSDCFGLILGQFCDFAYSEIEVNGTLIKTVNYNQTATNYNETISASEYAHLISNTNEACFTIRVFKECTLTGTSEIFSATKCIPSLKEGDEFSEVRYDGPVRQETLECQPDKAITVCCGDASVTISSNITYGMSSSQANTLDISFGNFSVGGNAFEVDFPITYTSSTNFTSSSSASTTISRYITLSPEPGICKSAALNINFLKEYTDYYSVGDCEEEILPYITQITGEAVFNVTFHECVLYLCPQERPDIVLHKKSSKVKFRNGCMGSIVADLPPDYEGELDFSWTGPYEFTSNSQNLENVLFGAYTLTVSDDCCNEYAYSYFLCDDIQHGAWQKQTDGLIFCRSLHCNNETCDIEDTEECVEPDEIIETYENGTCIEKYYFEGDFLGEVSGDTELKMEYNEATQQCIKIAKCKNDEYIIDQGQATYGFWEFNYALEECNRLVYCFDEVMAGLTDTKDPEIEETFDIITGLCNRTAYCTTGVPIILAPKSPIISNPWQWSEFQGCTKYVQCSNESGVENIGGQEGFTNWSYNSITNQCESDVTCEYSWVPGATHSEFPSSTGIWNWSSDRPLQVQCYRSILCGGTTFIEDTAQPTYQTTGIPCGGGLFQYYIICSGVNTFEVGCGSFQSNTIDSETRASNAQSEKLDVNIFPNPFSNLIHIEGLDASETYELEILNAMGQLVYDRAFDFLPVELDHLIAGMYILKIKQENQPIIVKRISKN